MYEENVETNDVTIDLETVDTTPAAGVLTIGVVTFNPESNTEPYNKVHIALDYNEQRDSREFNPDTLSWWQRQSPEAKVAAFGGERVPVKEGLNQLISYIEEASPVNIWGQGYGFDLTILDNMFRQAGLESPWKFYQTRDSRTLFSVCNNLGIVEGDPRGEESLSALHNAAEDAYWQSKGVQKCIRAMKGIKDD